MPLVNQDDYDLDHRFYNKMFKHESDTALDMGEPVGKNESVSHFQHYSYDARVPDARGRIELQFQDTSRYFLPAETFIKIEGRLSKNDNTPYGEHDRAGFVNNGAMALFKSAIYTIDGREIETIHDNVDVATTSLGLARYPDDYTRQLVNQ